MNKKEIKPCVHTYHPGIGYISNRTFEEVKEACGGKLLTIVEFEKMMIKRIEELYKKYNR